LSPYAVEHFRTVSATRSDGDVNEACPRELGLGRIALGRIGLGHGEDGQETGIPAALLKERLGTRLPADPPRRRCGR
jgi:hypothetical protein